MLYVAYTQKGIEDVCKKEIVNKLPGVIILEVRDKIILFDYLKNVEKFKTLRTIDDIGLLVINNTISDKDLADYDNLSKKIANANIKKAIDTIIKIRQINLASFSLTVNSINTNQSSNEIKLILYEKLPKELDIKYDEKDHSNFDIKININNKSLLVAVKLFSKSLYQRDYKVLSGEGALKPTIAAAMLNLATNGQTGLKIVDNFCGTGTILCEALLEGNFVFGGDIDDKKVLISKKNVGFINRPQVKNIRLLNASKTQYQSNYFDMAVSNLPWDNKIKIDRISSLYEESFREYRRILKEDGSFCFLCIKPDLAINKIRRAFGNIDIKMRQIGYLGNKPFLIFKQRING